MLSEQADRLAAEWLERLDDAARASWVGLDADRRRRGAERIAAILSVRELGAAPKAAAASIGLPSGRFYQLLRAWESTERGSLESLGLGAAPGTRRAPKSGKADAKGRALAAMRAMLEAGDPVRTSEALERAASATGGEVSRSSLLRWWKIERRSTPAGLLGSLLAFDLCPLGLRRDDGRLHVAAFVVERGTRTLLGAALSSVSAPSVELYSRAAADALERLPTLRLRRSPGARRTRRLSVATRDESAALLSLLSATELPKSGMRTMHDERRFGLSVTGAVGDRLGGIRLLPGAFEGSRAAPADDGLAPTSLEDAAAALALAMAADGDRVRLRQSALEDADDGEDALQRIAELLRRTVEAGGPTGSRPATGGKRSCASSGPSRPEQPID